MLLLSPNYRLQISILLCFLLLPLLYAKSWQNHLETTESGALMFCSLRCEELISRVSGDKLHCLALVLKSVEYLYICIDIKFKVADNSDSRQVLHMIQLDRPSFHTLPQWMSLLMKMGKMKNYDRQKLKKIGLRHRNRLCLRCGSDPSKEPSTMRKLEKDSNQKMLSTPIVEENDHGIDSPILNDRGDSLLNFFKSAIHVFKADKLGVEIAAIALPALITLTADPLVSLVDTAFIGRIGSVELAAVGVSIAVFNLVSKLLNIPILNITTSFVAEEEARKAMQSKVLDLDYDNAESEEGDPLLSSNSTQGSSTTSESNKSSHTKNLLHGEFSGYSDDRLEMPAISTSVIVSASVGFIEACILFWGAGPILDIMGVPLGSDMRVPAEQYLTLRAIGAPAVVLSLSVQGVFRGFKDTQTPLYSTVSGNILNILLVPIFTFFLHFGVSGAAVATVISQYFIAFILLWKLNRVAVLLPPKYNDLKLGRFLKTGLFLLTRSAAAMLSLTIATSEAARLGPIPMAAHQICMQVWLATSLLSDAIALAGQAIIATSITKRDFEYAKDAVNRTLQMGLIFGLTLSLLLGVGLTSFSKFFTDDVEVLRILDLGVPIVAITQPITALAFVYDGIYFGASDFQYAAYSMALVAFSASIVIIVATPQWGFTGVWSGLAIFMTFRMVAGYLRLATATGPWKFLKE